MNNFPSYDELRRPVPAGNRTTKQRKVRPHAGVTAEQRTPMTTPINTGESWEGQPRDWKGQWTKDWVSPMYRGPVKLTRVKKPEIKKRASAKQSKLAKIRRAWKWVRHPYRTWKRKKINQYKREAKRVSHF